MQNDDIEWDESRGGPRGPDNLISFPDHHTLYKATKAILPWQACGPHDKDRVVLASRFVERIFRKAPVKDPKENKDFKFMTRCLDIQYLAGGLALLLSEGLCEVQDEDGDVEPVIFDDLEDFQEAANRLMLQLKDDPTVEVTRTSWEWLEGFSDRQGTDDDKIAWFSSLTLEEVTERTNDLEVYTDLNMMLGPRSTEDSRVDQSGLFFALVADGGGFASQILMSIKKVYHPGDAPNKIFLLARLASFFVDTQWPAALRMEFQTSEASRALKLT